MFLVTRYFSPGNSECYPKLTGYPNPKNPGSDSLRGSPFEDKWLRQPQSRACGIKFSNLYLSRFTVPVL
jgi:hypothetical protein